MEPQFVTKKQNATAGYGQFSMEPLPLSFGNSIGNALRRTLLSSLKGAAVTQVKITGAVHQFATLKGVKESALEVILNLKKLRFETPSQGQYRIKLEVKGKKKVTGKDVEGEVKVVNKDQYIAEITDDKTKLELEAIVETGTGLLTEDSMDKQTGYIAVDAFFSPVQKVTFKVEEARVGRKTNFDRLVMDVWTDETVSPEEALKQATSILQKHFGHVLSGKDSPQSKSVDEKKQEDAKEIDAKLNDIIIDELNLPSRVINALLRENIETVADLVRVGKDKLIGVKGLGKKSFVLIEDELKKMDVDI